VRQSVLAKSIVVFLFFSISGCVSASISVVDERTALENQILGSYEELDHNLQLLASVRAVDASGNTKKTPNFSDIRKQAIQARQTHQFNHDDVEELKQKGCLGEANDGTLSARPCTQSSEPATAERIKRIIESENEARKIILQFIVTTSPDLTEKDLPEVSKAYTRMQHETAKPGEWVQLDSGEWVKKG
jgi:uncharacterized protein YdbL (DUF1318 family)